MSNTLRLILKINFKTIYFNFKYFPIKTALKFPVLLSRKVSLLKTKGEIKFNCPIYPGMIHIGFGKIGAFDRKYSRSIWEVGGDVIFNGKANIGHGSKIIVGENGVLEFGKSFIISAEATIFAHHSVKFGDDCLISWDTLFMDSDFHKIKSSGHEVINPPKPIAIGNHVWIGCRSLILKGSSLPNGSIIAANSLVTKPLEKENCLYGGNPVKLIKENVFWENE